MTPAEVKKLSIEDLRSEATRLRRDIFELRCRTTSDKIPDNSRIGKARKDLARVLTEQTARRAASKTAPSTTAAVAAKN